MLFNSINYFIFLPLVFIVYYIVPVKQRWLVLLFSSFVFYLIADVSTIIIPVITIVITFVCGLLLENTKNKRLKKLFLVFGLIVNIGLLFFYKYINFFIATFIDSFNFLNRLLNVNYNAGISLFTLNIIVPLGISYITFQAIGYLIEINRGNQSAEKNPGRFGAYLMFFPKLLSGPIERSTNFLPQLYGKHDINYELIVEGIKRIIWGLFLKLVIANRLELYTDAVFKHFENQSGITLLVASVFYTIRLYADFAGYTDIAIGSALLFGYRLMDNFNRPFVSKSVSEFWRRWHISLSSWVNEYIYTPIAINLRSWNKFAVLFAGMVTFLILGFWHGASWNYLFFGFLQGFILGVEFLTRKLRKKIAKRIPAWIDTTAGICFTFCYFVFSTIFFKVATLSDGFNIIARIIANKGSFFIGDLSIFIYSLFGILLLFIKDFTNEFIPNRFQILKNKNPYIRIAAYSIIVIFVLLLGVYDGGQFIYFQF